MTERVFARCHPFFRIFISCFAWRFSLAVLSGAFRDCFLEFCVLDMGFVSVDVLEQRGVRGSQVKTVGDSCATHMLAPESSIGTWSQYTEAAALTEIYFGPVNFAADSCR